MGINRCLRDERGQMTVELVVALPVLIAVSVVVMNALLFMSECASFDRLARDAVRSQAASPGYQQGLDQSCAFIQSRLDEEFSDRDYLSTSVSVSNAGSGHACFRANLDFWPTLFGRGLKSQVFGVSLTPLRHSIALTVDPYKPGVFF